MRGTRRILGYSVLAASLIAGGLAYAHGMGGGNAAEFKPVEMKMSDAMMAANGSTLDATFAKKMIAHHQGALDMAKIEIEHGRDADLKTMARKMIEEQTRSQSELAAWLKAHAN